MYNGYTNCIDYCKMREVVPSLCHKAQYNNNNNNYDNYYYYCYFIACIIEAVVLLLNL